VNLVQKLIIESQKKLSNQFIRNLSWLSVSEITFRVMRLGIVVIVARFLTPYDYGLAAIVMTVREFSMTFIQLGITAKIIQAEENELDALCNSAYWLTWVVFISLFIIQCLAAFPVAWFYKTQDLILPICVSSIAFILWPISLIQKTLIQRENRFKIIALTDSSQNVIGTILSAIFAVLGMGVWAFVLPAVLATPLEILIYFRYNSWRPSQKFTTKYWGEIFRFGKNILGVNLLRTLRNNLDYLIVGHFIGVKELGIYFFGFNAGLGISLSIINSINAAILPHLCAARNEWIEFKKRYFGSLKAIACVIVPFALLQSSLAPYYVPIVFGHKWIPAIPILMLICLSAIPRPFADAASQLLVAIGKPHLDLRWHIIFTGIFTVALLIGIQWNVIGVATSVLLAHAIFLPLFTIWASSYVFKKTKFL
jgi:teichuronic acid exporter